MREQKMKKTLLPLLFAFTLSSAIAQQKPTRDEVVKLIEMTDKKQLPTSMKEELYTDILKQTPMDDAHKASFLLNLDSYLQKATDDMVNFYTERYTKEDIKTIMDFYQTPIGLKIQQNGDKLLELRKTISIGLTDVINASVKAAYGE